MSRPPKDPVLPEEALKLFDSLIENLFNATQKYTTYSIEPPSKKNLSKESVTAHDSGIQSENSFLITNTPNPPNKCPCDVVKDDSQSHHPEMEVRPEKKEIRPFCDHETTPRDSSETTVSFSSRKSVTNVYSNDEVERHDFIKVKCCDEKTYTTEIPHHRYQAGKEPVVNYPGMESFFMMQDTPSLSTVGERCSPHDIKNIRIEQNAYLTTKRLANNRDGCELTFSTLDAEGKPVVIRVVCPDFEPRRVWLNDVPFDYIDNESADPILGGLDLKDLFQQQESERARVEAYDEILQNHQDNSDEDDDSCTCSDCLPEKLMRSESSNPVVPSNLCKCSYCSGSVDPTQFSEPGGSTKPCSESDCDFSDTEYNI